MDKYHEYHLRSIKNVYGIKPTLWVYNYDTPKIISEIADVQQIPDVIMNNISDVRCVGDNIRNILTMTDYVRYYVLYMHGGIYFDMDGISYKSILEIPNVDIYDIVVGKYKCGTVNGAVMYVKNPFNSHMHSLMTMFIKIMSNHKQMPWALTGPTLITHYTNVNYNNMNMLIMPHQAFYIYEWQPENTAKIFAEGGCKDSDLEQIYFLHLWSSDNSELLKTIDDDYIKNSNNLYTTIARGVI